MSYRSALLPLIFLPVLFTVTMLFLPETGPRSRRSPPASIEV